MFWRRTDPGIAIPGVRSGRAVGLLPLPPPFVGKSGDAAFVEIDQVAHTNDGFRHLWVAHVFEGFTKEFATGLGLAFVSYLAVPPGHVEGLRQANKEPGF